MESVIAFLAEAYRWIMPIFLLRALWNIADQLRSINHAIASLSFKFQRK